MHTIPDTIYIILIWNPTPQIPATTGNVDNQMHLLNRQDFSVTNVSNYRKFRT